MPMRKFPSYRQLDTMDCGPTCLRIIASHYGRSWSLQTLRERCHISREGVSLLGISDAAEAVGFRTMGVKLTFAQLCEEAVLPCIVHWNQNHFVVVYRIEHRRGKTWVHVSDPASGLLRYTREQFLKSWISIRENNAGDSDAKAEGLGIALLLEPTPGSTRRRVRRTGGWDSGAWRGISAPTSSSTGSSSSSSCWPCSPAASSA